MFFELLSESGRQVFNPDTMKEEVYNMIDINEGGTNNNKKQIYAGKIKQLGDCI